MGKAKVKPSNREQRRRALQRGKQLEHGRIYGKSIDRILSDNIPSAAKELASQTVVVANAFESVRESMASFMAERMAMRPLGPGSVLFISPDAKATIESIDDEGVAHVTVERLTKPMSYFVIKEEWLDDGKGAP